MADAIREHEIALEGDPYNEQFKTNLSGACLRYGDMLASKKKYYEAMIQYRKALWADPANAVADKNLDECLRASGKTETIQVSVTKLPKRPKLKDASEPLR